MNVKSTSILLYYDKMLNILYPNKCIFCKEIIPLGDYACHTCSESLPRFISDSDLESDSKSESLLYDQHEHNFGYALQYVDPVPKGIAELKFRDRPKLAKYFAKLMAEIMGGTMRSMGINMICCVPMHPTKEKKRGYNQAGLLAKELSLQMHIPFEKDVLIKIIDNKIQHELGGVQRRQNVRNVYAVSKHISVQGKRIALVDDILTTGATLQECTRVLKLDGAELVFGAVVARAIPVLQAETDVY